MQQAALFKPSQTATVLVVGDIILDQYIYGDTQRISPEAPVPIVKVSSSEDRPGGAANVAINVSSLGVKVQLVGVVGNDAAAECLSDLLSDASVESHLLKQSDFPTITKQRVLSQHQQLLRLDYENAEHAINLQALLDTYAELVPSASVIILSDYAKGCLAESMNMIDLANQHNIPVFIDPKSNDFSVYKNASLITPNLKEFEAIVGHCETDEALVTKGHKLREQLNLKALLVTRGEKGMTLIEDNGRHQHLQAQTHEVYDVTGAGDTVIATLATASACGYELGQAMKFANIAAGLVVEKLGAASITSAEINVSINKENQQAGVMSADEAVVISNDYKNAGQRVVMTNGCFDILHTGHINYLREAKALGDKLLVAVNSDSSVKHLKGNSRPVNKLEDRMQMLAALACVDIVVAFDEDTPENLIKKINPDVLVKGGDYSEDQIAGAGFVKQQGGEVKLLPFHQGYSTTEILKAANRAQGIS